MNVTLSRSFLTIRPFLALLLRVLLKNQACAKMDQLPQPRCEVQPRTQVAPLFSTCRSRKRIPPAIPAADPEKHGGSGSSDRLNPTSVPVNARGRPPSVPPSPSNCCLGLVAAGGSTGFDRQRLLLEAAPLQPAISLFRWFVGLKPGLIRSGTHTFTKNRSGFFNDDVHGAPSWRS